MTDNNDILRRIDEEEQRLRPLLEGTAVPSEEAIERVRQMVRMELQADVLGRFEAPVPSDAVVTRIKQAVRSEIEVSRRQTSTRRVWRVYAALSAAACLFTAIGLIRWVMPGFDRSSAGNAEPALELVESTAQAFQSALDHRNVALSLLAEDINQISDGSVHTATDAVETELGDIGREIDDVFIDTTWPSET